MAHPANSVTLSGKSGASSGKAEDEGVAGSYVEDENAARGIIWLAGTHGYLRDWSLVATRFISSSSADLVERNIDEHLVL